MKEIMKQKNSYWLDEEMSDDIDIDDIEQIIN